jgi:transposase-like protein
MPGVDHRQHMGPNSRVENSDQQTRQRERIMKRFKSPRHVQRLLSTYDQTANVPPAVPAKAPPLNLIPPVARHSPPGQSALAP